jgi:hypothetical protein
MKYRVYVPEVHYATVVVEANSFEEAFQKVIKAEDGDIVNTDYSHTIDPEISQWEVYNEDDGIRIFNSKDSKGE